MTVAKPQYVPKSEEMQDAVFVALRDVKTIPSAKELKKIIATENPSWKLTERRVGKYLRREIKKQKKQSTERIPTGQDDDEDDNESVISTASSRAREAIKATAARVKKAIPFRSPLKSFRKKKQEKKDAVASAEAVPETPPMMISTPSMDVSTPMLKSMPSVEDDEEEFVVEQKDQPLEETDEESQEIDDIQKNEEVEVEPNTEIHQEKMEENDFDNGFYVDDNDGSRILCADSCIIL